MPQFSSAPLEEVIPQRKQRQPSQRAEIQRQYQEAVRQALLDKHEALIVTLDPDDKPLTIRNRIKRAADTLGLDSVVIRRKKDRIVAYQSAGEEDIEDEIEE